MAQKRKSLPIDASEKNGATFRVLAHYGFLHSRPLSTEERTAWAAVFPWPVGRVREGRIDTAEGPAGFTQGDALALLQHDCAFTFTWLNGGEAGATWEQVRAWLCTTKAPNYEPPKGRPVRELDPDFTAEGATPVLACLALIAKRVGEGEWRLQPNAWGCRVAHAVAASTASVGNPNPVIS